MKIKASMKKVNEALNKISDVGSVSVNGSDGKVSVKGVDANFSFDENAEELTITITDKPWLVSESFVEDEIRKFFN